MFAEITLLSANWFFVSRSSEQDSNVWRSHAVKMSRFEVVSWLFLALMVEMSLEGHEKKGDGSLSCPTVFNHFASASRR